MKQYNRARACEARALCLGGYLGLRLGSLLRLHSHEDLLSRNPTLGQLDVVGGLRRCVAESASNEGQTLSGYRSIPLIISSQSAALAASSHCGKSRLPSMASAAQAPKYTESATP